MTVCEEAMPIDYEAFNDNFITAEQNQTITDLLRRLPPDRKQRLTFYVVAPADNGRYLLVSWCEIEEFAWDAARQPDERRTLPLGRLTELFLPVAAVDQASLETDTAHEQARQQPGQRLVILAEGRVIGVLVLESLYQPSENDPFGLAKGSDDLGVVLGPGDELPPPVHSKPPEGPAVDDRVFNAWIANQPKDQPLEAGKRYELRFNVDSPRADATTAMFDAEKAFRGLPPDVNEVEITVALDSDDVDIIGSDQQVLVVPRTGPSEGDAIFQIKPKANGIATVNAVFIANNRIFQKMTMMLQVGTLAKNVPTFNAETRGLAFAGTVALPPRPNVVNLVIERRENGYLLRLLNGGSARAFLNLSETKIADLILRARDALKNIVYQRSQDGQFVYQQLDTTIPAEVHAETLKSLARLGFYLYQELFFAPGNGVDAQNLGNLLRQISQQKQLRIAIVAERFIFPWALLYDRPQVDMNAIDPDSFWGFKHVVEYMPEFANPTPVSFIPQINVTGNLKLGFVCNTTIDDELTRKGLGPVVKPQSEFLKTLQGVEVTEYPNRGDLYGLLGNPDNPEQLLYFYCHAVSNLPGEKDGVDGSRFLLSDGAASVADMKFEAPITGVPLRQAPLVFLNACQSAELSPFLYDGLIPYLVGKGMRGVIGTEVDTPALFAAEFAREFLTRFTAGGKPLGDLLLELRREYLEQKNNVMGLLYALYSNGEVVVSRG